jgi:hypothetical protein
MPGAPVPVRLGGFGGGMTTGLALSRLTVDPGDDVPSRFDMRLARLDDDRRGACGFWIAGVSYLPSDSGSRRENVLLVGERDAVRCAGFFATGGGPLLLADSSDAADAADVGRGGGAIFLNGS